MALVHLPVCRQTEKPLLITKWPLVLSTAKPGDPCRPAWSMFTLLIWRVNRFSTEHWRTFQTQMWRSLLHQNSLGAASGSQDKGRLCNEASGPAHSNTHASCSLLPTLFGAKCFSLLAVVLTLRCLFCPAQSYQTCCFLSLSHPSLPR